MKPLQQYFHQAVPVYAFQFLHFVCMKENLGVTEDFKAYHILFIIKSGLPVNKSLGKPFGIDRSQKETD